MPFTAHAADLAGLAAADRLRCLTPRSGSDFASNDYLGLSRSAELRGALAEALARGVPVGSGGSRLLRGNHDEHGALEAEAAAHWGSESALFFGSGFAANAGLLATLPQRGDLIVHDALVHASAHEGIRLSRAEATAFPHNDADAAEAAIVGWRARGGTGTPWIAVETLYSMDGDRAPLSDLAEVAARRDAVLLLDEAHAAGVFGEGGRGLGSDLHGRPNVVTLVTCGKALGCEGALLLGPHVVRDHLVNRARGFVFSTAPSPLIAAGVRAAIALVADQPERRTRLAALCRHAEARLVPLGATATGSQILPLLVGRDGAAMALAAAAQAGGFDVRGIRPPTVPAGTARLRLSITLNIGEAEVDGLADLLATQRIAGIAA